MKTYDEHLKWCKERAREYLASGDIESAVTSMLSDLRKHPEGEAVAVAMAPVGLLAATTRDLALARQFIEGFRA